MRRVFVAAALLVLVAVNPASASAKSDIAIAMDDGVSIAATYYFPDGDVPAGGWPTLLLMHGIGESRTDETNALGMSINGMAETYLRAQGYAVLTVDARGHGASGGLVSIDGPREIADVRAFVQWLASRPWVNPRQIGAFGYSYGAGALLRAAAEGVPLAALGVAVGWTDLYRALVPQRLARSGVILGFYTSVAARAAPELQPILQDALAGRNLASVKAFADARSTRPLLGSIRVPTFVIQGRRDFAFDVDQGLAAFNRLGGPKRLYLTNLGHAPSNGTRAELDYMLPQARLWFDRFLKGLPNGIDTRAPLEIAPDPWTGRVAAYARPPRAATRRVLFQRRPVSIGSRGKVVRTAPRIKTRIETFGAPTVRLRLSSATGWPHVVVVLSALTPQRKEIVVSDGGARVGLSRKPRTIAIKLISQVTAIPARSRLRLTIAATSTAQSPGNLLYLTGVSDSARLTVSHAQLTLPVLAKPVSR
ncbi:MAG TPA: CocE/NonD family hydrolase [Gaiellaceae bacterium]|jgi:predicted acyl esterase|nr:CocE/NonD family hydrolase [Gaiellaceae bacterium]